ncbi:MAG: hypothetical protein WAT68_10425 [Candidatus Nitrotoga sp.]
MPVTKVMAWPHTPHFSKPVSNVGHDTKRGDLLVGARDSRFALTRSKVAASTMAGIVAFIHSSGGRLVLALESRILVKYSPI